METIEVIKPKEKNNQKVLSEFIDGSTIKTTYLLIKHK
jgi:hypothetical protein